jgi:hypothetical protein
MGHQLERMIGLARDVAIQKMIFDAEHQFAPIPWFQYEFAQKIFAAEFDGDPYVFPYIDNALIVPVPWVRCIIRVIYPYGPEVLRGVNIRYYHYISHLRCHRLICNFQPLPPVDANEVCRICRTCHANGRRFTNAQRPMCIRELGADTLSGNYSVSAPHVDIKQLFIAAAFQHPPPPGEGDEYLRAGREFITRSERMHLVHGIEFLIDEQIRPATLNGVFVNARIMPMKGRNLEEFETESLHDALVAAREKTKNIVIPLCERDITPWCFP